MNFIENIRRKIGEYFFKKEYIKVNRSRRIVNIDDAKTIAILYDASDESTYGLVNDFVKYFQENQKIVKALGYVNYNILPHYCFPKLSYDYIIKRDLNWYFRPKNIKVGSFVNEEFDILIDLCMHDCFPLKYISGISLAKFKVGRFDEKNSVIYDFMLNVNQSVTLDQYMKEAIHYLSIINKNQAEQ